MTGAALKALAILEVVSERDGATARELSAALRYPLPTVYRLLAGLVRADWMVRSNGAQRFEVGFRMDRLAARAPVPEALRREVVRLGGLTGFAASFAVYRGVDVAVVCVAEGGEHPPLDPAGFGLHQAAHATVFGKILLARVADGDVTDYLAVHGLKRFTETTLSSRPALDEELCDVTQRGVAWDRGEFLPGMTSAAAAVRNATGMTVGALALSAPSASVSPLREASIEQQLRAASNRISAYYRAGGTVTA